MPESGTTLLEATGLTKSFAVPRTAKGSTRLRALEGVDLRLARGETLGLVGESGCGKTTLARVLLMLERPDAGTVRFDGVDPFSLSGAKLLAWRRKVQMVFQDPFGSLNPRLCAADLISEPWLTHRDLVPAAKRAARVGELLEMVGLRASDARRYPQEFSGGQRQRIGIARALALEPDVIVCDEPVSALDLSVQAQVLNLLGDLRDELGLAYVFISHDLSVVRHVADRVAVMYLGRIVETGPAEELFEQPRHPLYGGAVVGGPVPGDRGRAEEGAHPAHRRDPVTGRPALRLQIQNPLLASGGHLRRISPDADARDCPPQVGLPLPPGGGDHRHGRSGGRDSLRPAPTAPLQGRGELRDQPQRTRRRITTTQRSAAIQLAVRRIRPA